VYYGDDDMQEPDHTALFRFATHRRDADFRLLAERYLGLIFQTSLRRTGNRQLAEEASQNVLCALAKKAAALAKHPDRLPAWLHRAALFESSKAMRSEISHQRRKALEHPDSIDSTASEESTVWTEILPHLDLALDRLPASDRTLLLQHYFEQMSFPQIGELHSRPAATVQKQSRRALEKLAKILRGKGFVVTTTALATGFGAECAKGAPARFLRIAASHALASTSYSTTPLTLFMAMKSKTLIPLVLLLAFTPLVIQQLAIARASARLDSLGGFTASRENPSRQPSRNPRIVSRTSFGKTSIATLSRAYDEMKSGGALKSIAFDDLLAALGPNEIVGLIPQAISLPDSQTKRSDLLGHLIRLLEKTDPGLAVKTTLAADPRGQLAMMSGLPATFSAWATKNPDAAFAFFRELLVDQEFNPISTQGIAWGGSIQGFHHALLGALVATNSPHVRDVILMAPEYTRSQNVLNAISYPSRETGMSYGITAPYERERLFSSFLPLFREFVPEKDFRRAIESLVFELQPWNGDAGLAFGGIMDSAGLSPDERVIVAEAFSSRKLGTYYNTTPRPDLETVESTTRQWLETHIPEHATEIFEKTRTAAYEAEMFQARMQLERLTSEPDLDDTNLIIRLNRRFYGEMLPLAIEQAGRIKDPEKRAEVLRQLQTP
jgi:RNA polymerase sigma factor (sigma-70 family)